ncbi:hypothetical protein [Deinococcus humi]|uniref:Right handed beta helix domain-containing protein n=1 Tax=Deinococcus humi TaxID=662880 RepID=A0A7W8JTC0_9DEIO|nr:hypothetical protein [Deinococcus humi]MBB5362408.1 hypothetical protein [Deinococcus humi]
MRITVCAALMFGALTVTLTACAPYVDTRAIVPENDPSEGPAYAGPLVITRGGTYQGNWQSFDPEVAAVTIKTRERVVIENSFLRGRGNLIRGINVNLIVRNTTGYGLNPLTNGSFPGRFLSVEDVLNLVVENNNLFGTSGIYVHLFKGNPAAGQTIRILRNRIRNVDGRYVDYRGKFTDKRYYVQAIQFNRVARVPNIEIAWNEVINEPGKSAVEDNFSMYESSGTASSPIRIHDNYIDGAYAANPLKAQKYSGGGILLGDGKKDDMDIAGGYAEVYNNQIINTSNHGIGLAGGHHHKVYGNRIVSAGLLPGGVIDPNANVGLYVWNINGSAKNNARTFINNSIQKNIVGWKRFGPAGKVYYHNLWTPSCLESAGNICKDNEAWPDPVGDDIASEEFARWQQKLSEAKVIVGVHNSVSKATSP